jgi:hypothetical protein
VIVLTLVRQRPAVERSLSSACADRGWPEPAIWSTQAGPGAQRLPGAPPRGRRPTNW